MLFPARHSVFVAFYRSTVPGTDWATPALRWRHRSDNLWRNKQVLVSSAMPIKAYQPQQSRDRACPRLHRRGPGEATISKVLAKSHGDSISYQPLVRPSFSETHGAPKWAGFRQSNGGFRTLSVPQILAEVAGDYRLVEVPWISTSGLCCRRGREGSQSYKRNDTLVLEIRAFCRSSSLKTLSQPLTALSPSLPFGYLLSNRTLWAISTKVNRMRHDQPSPTFCDLSPVKSQLWRCLWRIARQSKRFHVNKEARVRSKQSPVAKYGQ